MKKRMTVYMYRGKLLGDMSRKELRRVVDDFALALERARASEHKAKMALATAWRSGPLLGLKL